MRRPMQNHVASEIYEPFAGSGTTLIAAEQLGRRCFAIEIEPVYVQIIIDRWEAFTGQTANKVGEAVRA
jgi:DNA modification methylase